MSDNSSVNAKPRTTISACIVAREEQPLIGRCLAALEGVVDEIVVVHDGECRDATLRICEAAGARVFPRPFRGGGALHEAFAAAQASGDWLLFIDADEYPSAELRARLRDLVDSPVADAYGFVRPLWNGRRYVTRHWPVVTALFRRDLLCITGLPQDRRRTRGRTVATDLVLEHRPGYNAVKPSVVWGKILRRSRRDALSLSKPDGEFERFQSTPADFSIEFRLQRRAPLLSAPLVAAWRILGPLAHGGWRELPYGWIWSAWWGLHACMVSLNLWRMRRASAPAVPTRRR